MNERRRETLLEDERGIAMTEYIIILFLIAISGILIWQQFGVSVDTKVESSDTQISSLDSY